jgi:shikimate kinase
MPGQDILYVIGLTGSGKSAVAAHLAKELGRPALSLPLDGAEAALDAILAQGSAVVEVPHKLLGLEALRTRLHHTGRVLYLMAGVEAIAARLAASPQEEPALRELLGRPRSAYETWFMQTRHLLVMADGPLGQVQAEALERVRCSAPPAPHSCTHRSRPCPPHSFPSNCSP